MTRGGQLTFGGVTNDDIDVAKMILRVLADGHEPYAPAVYPAARMVAEARHKLGVPQYVPGHEEHARRRAIIEATWLVVQAAARIPPPTEASAPIAPPARDDETIGLTATLLAVDDIVREIPAPDSAPSSPDTSSFDSGFSGGGGGGGGESGGGGSSGEW